MRTEKKTPDGIEIIARGEARGPHPHPRLRGRIVAYSGVTRLLLADEREVFECDDCGRNFDSLRSAVSHRNGVHVAKPRGPMYPENTIRLVLRLVREYRPRSRDFNVQVAEELNRREVPTVRGDRWTANMVHTLSNAYRDVYRVRVSRPTRTPVAAAAEVAVAENGDVTHALDELLAIVRQLSDGIAQVSWRVREISAVDPELVDKARRYDEMMRLLRPGG